MANGSFERHRWGWYVQETKGGGGRGGTLGSTFLSDDIFLDFAIGVGAILVSLGQKEGVRVLVVEGLARG